MKHEEQEIYSNRENKQSRYDKRLILKIVQEVENGLPRKEANRIYDLGKNSISSWMREYGSSTYQETIKRRSYTKLQKRTIVNAIEQGRFTLKEAKTAYNIK
ncbi:IS630 transposase-related protein, partial [Polaribacter gangjinensis]